MPNQWRSGRDPLLRWLRIISVIAFLGLITLVVLDPVRSSNIPLAALLVGACLLQLGYEVVVPGLTDRRKPPADDDADDRG